MKVTLIGSEKSPHWKSCRSIVNNLFEAYSSSLGRSARTLLFDQGVMQYFDSEREYYTQSFARDILSNSPDRVIFVGDFPLAPLILKELVEVAGGVARLERITFIVHVFGDFPLRVGEWHKVEDLLKGLKIRFICASDRQGEFIGQLLRAPDIEVSPFPIEPKLFYFDPVVRKTIRKKMGLQPKNKLYLYSGRMSILKNIGSLMSLFSELALRDPDAQFVFAGGFDDLITPVFRSKMPEGQYFQMIQSSWSQLPDNVRERVRFLGDLNIQSLRELLNASDVFVSLSLYHDEDYGMAPGEAICCGLPVVLSDWGGYTSFRRYSKDVHLVAPSLLNEGFFFNHDETLNLVQRVGVLSDAERVKAGKESLAMLSPVSVGKKLSKIMESSKALKFNGMSERAGCLYNCVSSDNDRLTLGSNEYKWIYEPYYKKESPMKELQ